MWFQSSMEMVVCGSIVRCPPLRRCFIVDNWWDNLIPYCCHGFSWTQCEILHPMCWLLWLLHLCGVQGHTSFQITRVMIFCWCVKCVSEVKPTSIEMAQWYEKLFFEFPEKFSFAVWLADQLWSSNLTCSAFSPHVARAVNYVQWNIGWWFSEVSFFIIPLVHWH